MKIKEFLKELLLKENSCQLVWLFLLAHVEESVSFATIGRHAKISRVHASRLVKWGIGRLENLKIVHSYSVDEKGFMLTFKPLLNVNKKAAKIENYEKIKKIIDYLNITAGKKYKPESKVAIKYIDARLKENYSFEDFCSVINIKTKQWKNTKDEIYLRPETLFGNKFDGYLNQTNINTANLTNGQEKTSFNTPPKASIARTFATSNELIEKLFGDSQHPESEQ